MSKSNLLLNLLIAAGTFFTMSCSEQTGTGKNQTAVEEPDAAEVIIGERLFLETRFAQAYFADKNKPDANLEYTLTMDSALPGPFAGKTISCRSCHMVDEHVKTVDAGMRTYADFIDNSPIPERNDGHNVTTRNSMSLVNFSTTSDHNVLFHFDGEFNSMQDLVRATLIGRNYGWLSQESEQAIKHIANIIRSDDGKNELARQFGGNYRKVLRGTDNTIPAGMILPETYRIDIDKASDKQILDIVGRLIAAYVNKLHFEQDEHGNYTGSPYDQFLILNNLPQQPETSESVQQYAARLLSEVNNLSSPRFVTNQNKTFQYHNQAFIFGEKELEGMKVFFTRGNSETSGGNCISCHTAPHFSDFMFHNTGLEQDTYDEVHGHGSFASLDIPELAARNSHYNDFLPATRTHPAANERFRSPINIDNPEYADLGVWNVFANPDMPAPQIKLQKLFCKKMLQEPCSDALLLPLTIAAFKTPILRDLGHSNPYMHNGRFNTLHEAVNFYITASTLARQALLRNADPELSHVFISQEDVDPLVAFLASLNEDYE